MPARRFAEVDLSELLRTVIEVYQPMAEEREQRFSAEIASRLVVWGDRELLAQMMANVIENAMKHSPVGASIGLTTSQSPSAIVVAVIDNGPGIPVADRGRVFQRFYRLESSRSTPGSGLGLSLVEAIATLHGVNIALTDNGPGLRVTLRFLVPDQLALAGDRSVKRKTQGTLWAVEDRAPAAYLNRRRLPARDIEVYPRN
jgi:signal transduction histidine kinase